MAVQFNLLPDVKVEYLKARKQQHTVTLISVVLAVIALSVLILSALTVYVVQTKTISDLDKDITSKSKELQGTKDLSKILTVQGQMKSLPALHEKKIIPSRLYNYLSQVTPIEVSLMHVTVDYQKNTMVVTGEAADLAMVNKFIDTLKFTTYSLKDSNGKVTEKGKNAFTSVVLTGFNRDKDRASYNISFSFDPVIFQGSKSVELMVPNTITTRSEVDKPTSLFRDPTGGQ